MIGFHPFLAVILGFDLQFLCLIVSSRVRVSERLGTSLVGGLKLGIRTKA